MSKILKVSGNFQQNSEWMVPDPAFEIEAVISNQITVEILSIKAVTIAREGEFIFGLCKELYEVPGENGYEDRYVIGIMREESIEFAKLSNRDDLAPIIYTANLDDLEKAEWGVPGVLFSGGIAKLQMEEQNYSEDRARKIVQELMERLDLSLPWNSTVFKRYFKLILAG